MARRHERSPAAGHLAPVTSRRQAAPGGAQRVDRRPRRLGFVEQHGAGIRARRGHGLAGDVDADDAEAPAAAFEHHRGEEVVRMRSANGGSTGVGAGGR
jgi:hypothetical protein